MGKLHVIAGTSGPFADFGPYVPSIDDRGTVAFFATRRGGATGVFCGNGGLIHSLHLKAAYKSHPDLNNHGLVCAYAELPDGSHALIRGTVGTVPEIVAHDAIPKIGPLGPTINDAGAIAFRATSAAGRAGIYVSEGATLTRVAEAGDRFAAFDGLPAIIADGSVVFRADHADGSQGIHVWRPGGELTCVAATGDAHEFTELGRFPSANADGVVVFAALRRNGVSGIYRAAGGTIEPVIESAKEFEAFRGALIDDAGRIIFYATPGGGTLGIYILEAEEPKRLLGLRDEFGTGPLIDLALNPVSLNNAGQLALRLKLADGRQYIARLDVFE